MSVELPQNRSEIVPEFDGHSYDATRLIPAHDRVFCVPPVVGKINERVAFFRTQNFGPFLSVLPVIEGLRTEGWTLLLSAGNPAPKAMAQKMFGEYAFEAGRDHVSTPSAFLFSAVPPLDEIVREVALYKDHVPHGKVIGLEDFPHSISEVLHILHQSKMFPDCVMTTVESQRRIYQRLYPDSVIVHTGNPANDALFLGDQSESSRVAMLRQELGISENDRLLVIVGKPDGDLTLSQEKQETHLKTLNTHLVDIEIRDANSMMLYEVTHDVSSIAERICVNTRGRLFVWYLPHQRDAVQYDNAVWNQFIHKPDPNIVPISRRLTSLPDLSAESLTVLSRVSHGIIGIDSTVLDMTALLYIHRALRGQQSAMPMSVHNGDFGMYGQVSRVVASHAVRAPLVEVNADGTQDIIISLASILEDVLVGRSPTKKMRENMSRFARDYGVLSVDGNVVEETATMRVIRAWKQYVG